MKQKLFFRIMIMCALLLLGICCVYCWKQLVFSKPNIINNPIHSDIKISIVNFNDRSDAYKEYDYYFYEDNCFIKLVEFAECSNKELPKVSYFLVQDIELERLHSILSKCYDIGCPPPWPPVPVFLLTVFDFNNQSETILGFLNREKLKPIMDEIKDLTVHKQRIQFVPLLFYEPHNSEILNRIQFVPEHNYP